MKKVIAAIGIATSQLLAANQENTISVPWREFKSLYSRSVIEEYTKAHTPVMESEGSSYSLINADYSVTLQKNYAQVKAELTGTIGGKISDRYTIFDNTVVVQDSADRTGITLHTGQKGLEISPQDKKLNQFAVTLNILVPIKNDASSKYIEFSVPHSVSHKISVSPSKYYTVTSSPDILKTDNGILYSTNPRKCKFNLHDLQSTLQSRPAVVTTYSHVAFNNGVLHTTTLFDPQTSGIPFRITLPDKAVLLKCSLPELQYDQEKNSIAIRQNKKQRTSFTIDTLLTPDAKSFKLSFPQIAGNSQSRFSVVEEDGWVLQVDPTIKPIRAKTPQLHGESKAKVITTCYSIESDQKVPLTVSRLKSVDLPTEVIDTVEIAQQYDETGRTMTVLKFTLKDSTKRYFNLSEITGVKVWYVKVNGKKQKLFVGTAGQWQVPVSTSKDNILEIAYAGMSKKLDISGKIETTLPALGFPAKKLIYNLTLPERIRLISFDGPLAENQIKSRKAGYSFVTSFYNGEALSTAIYYKENIDN